MDDQNQSGRDNQANIDNLVKELNRPQNVPPGESRKDNLGFSRPFSQPAQKQPASPTSPNISSLSNRNEVKQPNIPNPPGVPKEYQSSIRTMGGDLDSIKSGQKISGTEVPRKIETEKNQTGPSMQKPISKSDILPGQDSFSGAKVGLGETQKTRPIDSGSLPPPPSKPSPTFTMPDQPSSPSSLKMLSLALVVVIILLGFAYWFFILRTPDADVVQSPLPTASQTPTILTLDNIFVESAGTITLPLEGDPKNDFFAGLDQTVVGGGDVKKVRVENMTESGGSVPLDTLSLLGRFLASYPSELNSALGSESAVLIYGQKEIFNADGQLVLNSQNEKRLALVTEVINPDVANQSLNSWENSIPDGLMDLFAINKSKGSDGFLTNNYRGSSVRYKNFPYPDKSIDYGLVTTGSGKVYWIVTNSRESMFEVTDRLLSITNP